MELRIILYCCIITTVLASQDSNNHGTSSTSEEIDSSEDSMPKWEDQRDILEIHLCKIKPNDLNSKCPLVDVLIEKLNEDSSAKFDIVYAILNGTDSDIYGSQNDETADESFIDTVISNFIFQEVFGNNSNFLIFLLDVYDNITYTQQFKEKIKDALISVKLSETNGTLSNNSVKWISDNLIYPLLPDVNDKVDVFSFDYAYAQAGMILAKILNLNTTSASVDESIKLSQLVEMSVQSKDLDESSMQIFTLPVLFYYYSKHNGLKQIIKNELKFGTFNWTVAYRDFFFEMSKMNAHPVVRFFSAMSVYRTRTELAEEIIKENCTRIGNFEGNAIDYMNGGNNYACIQKININPNNEFLLKLVVFITHLVSGAIPKMADEFNYISLKQENPLRDVTSIFNMQNRYIADQFMMYQQLEIEKAINSNSQIKDELSKRLIHKGEIHKKAPLLILSNPMIEVVPLQIEKLLEDRVDLLGFSRSNSRDSGDCSEYYAIIHKPSGIEFSVYDKRYATDFYSDVIDPITMSLISESDIVMHCMGDSILKQATENITHLAKSVATFRATELLNYLTELGMDETGLEKMKRFFKALIPFLHGIQQIMKGEITLGIVELFFDLMAFIPVIGFSIKVSYTLLSNFIKVGVRSMIAKHSILSALRIGFLSTIPTAETLLFSRTALLNIGKSILRSLDPGFELIYMFGKSGLFLFHALRKKFGLLSQVVDKTMSWNPAVFKILNIKEIPLPHLGGKRFAMKIGQYAERNVYVKIRPTMHLLTNAGYGYKYLEFPNNRYMQLRRAEHTKDLIPVMPLMNAFGRGKKVFAELDIVTGETNGLRLIEKENGKLEYWFIDSKCIGQKPRLRRHNDKAPEPAQLSEIQVAKALSCSIEETKVLMKQYFLEEDGAKKLFVDIVTEEHVVPPTLDDLKIRYPDLIYSRKMFTPLNTPRKMANARSLITELYKPHELKLIDLNIDQVINSYNKLQISIHVPFEDYFAIRNFGHTGFDRIDEYTFEAMQMRNALRKLTIQQTYRLKRTNIVSYVFLPCPKVDEKRLMKKGKAWQFPEQFRMASTDFYEMLRNFPIDESTSGIQFYIAKLETSSDYLLADTSDMLSDNIVVYAKDIPYEVYDVQEMRFPNFEHLGNVKIVSLEHTPVNKIEYIKTLMSSIEEFEY